MGIFKQVPYEESIRTPFVIRDDMLIHRPRTERHLVLNLDVAQTFAAFFVVETCAFSRARVAVRMHADSFVPVRPLAWQARVAATRSLAALVVQAETQVPSVLYVRPNVDVPMLAATAKRSSCRSQRRRAPRIPATCSSSRIPKDKSNRRRRNRLRKRTAAIID